MRRIFPPSFALGRLFARMHVVWELVIIFACLMAFTGLTGWFVAYEINQSQHKFCDLVVTLNNAPAPPQASPGSQANPGRQFDERIAQDLVTLKRNLGC